MIPAFFKEEDGRTTISDFSSEKKCDVLIKER
jgi:hypothetical protein